MKKQWFLLLCMLLVATSGVTVAQDDGPVQIIFMHHSTGAGVMNDGDVRPALTNLGYEFWDHDYNEWGLSGPSGDSVGVNWDVPGDNTDPDGWYDIFSQPITDPPINTLSQMLEFDIIIFKSCFPASAIYDEDMFQAYQHYYLGIRDVIDYYPDKLFIPWTTPPLVPNETNADQAARARRWAEYLTSDEYLGGRHNIAVFDFFTLMADEEGFLRADYRTDEWDSHPNWTGNQVAGPALTEFVHQAILDFEPGHPIERPDIIIVDMDDDSYEAPENDIDCEDDGDEGTVPERVMTGDVIEDFEGGQAHLDHYWWTYSDGAGAEPELSVAEPGYTGDYALEFTFEVPIDHYQGLGTDFPELQDWSNADGIQFVWRSQQEGTRVAFLLFVADPESSEPTMFETHLTTPGEEWTQVWLYWEEFVKPEWAGNAGVDVFDPSQITGLSMDVGSWEQAQADTIWLDDLALMQ